MSYADCDELEKSFVVGLFAVNIPLLAENEMLQRIVVEADSLQKIRMLNVNVGKSKVTVFERTREQTMY